MMLATAENRTSIIGHESFAAQINANVPCAVMVRTQWAVTALVLRLMRFLLEWRQLGRVVEVGFGVTAAKRVAINSISILLRHSLELAFFDFN